MNIRSFNKINENIEGGEQLTLQDIFVCSSLNLKQKCYFAGEFGFDAINETEDQTVDRIFRMITKIADQVIMLHPNKKNHVTRLISNEFFFYTQAPLSMEAFQSLLNKLLSLAKTLSKNVHLVLGSFSVLTPDNKVMNITPFIECGEKPELHLVLKSTSSTIDPNYIKQDNDEITNYKNATKRNSCFIDIAFKINDASYPVSFDNVFLCKTLGGTKYICSVEICLDHLNYIAKNNFNNKINALIKNILNDIDHQDIEPVPKYSSHIVISNTVEPDQQSIIGSFAHADPRWTQKNFAFVELYETSNPIFGANHFIFPGKPYACKKLENSEKQFALLHSNFLLEKNKLTGSLKSSAIYSVVNRHFGDDMAALLWSLYNDQEQITYSLVSMLTKKKEPSPTVMNILKTVWSRMQECATRLSSSKSKDEKSVKKTIQLKIECFSYFDEAYLSWVKSYFSRVQDDKEPCLYEAVILNNLEITKKLIKNIDSLNEPDGIGNTPSHWAVFLGYDTVLKAFIKQGADITLENNNGDTLFSLAGKYRNQKILDLLHLQLKIAIDKNQEDIILTLLRAGADPNYKAVGSFNEEMSLFTYALECSKSQNIFAPLLKFTKDKSKTLLNYIQHSAKPDLEVIKTLVNKGADPHIQDDKKISAFQFAEKNKLHKVLELFNHFKPKDKIPTFNSIHTTFQTLSIKKKKPSNLSLNNK